MPLFRRKSEKSVPLVQHLAAADHGSLSDAASLLQAEDDPSSEFPTESRLSASLPSLLRNPDALAPFVQFLERCGGHCLLRFCLEVESLAALAQLRNGLVPLDGLREDLLNLYSKYILPKCLDLPEDIVHRIEADIQSHPGPTLFLPAFSHVLARLESDYLPRYLQSSQYYKHQVELLTSGTLRLADIIYHDASLFYFMEFMEQLKARHLVDFLLMAKSFRSNCQESGALDDAIVIYDKYFSLQATCSLGVSDKLRCAVEQNICLEGDKPPGAECFRQPERIVTRHLEKVYLPQFLTSPLFYHHLSECLAHIQNGGSPLVRKRSGSESSSTSEQSSTTTTTNTLLATDSSSRRIFNVKDGTCMRIESDKFRPESLWKRSLAGKLQITKVDKFGKVISEFQPEPDKKSTSSLLTKAVRKLVVRDDEEKLQEELAWETARDIVQDICSVTMGSPRSGAS